MLRDRPAARGDGGPSELIKDEATSRVEIVPVALSRSSIVRKTYLTKPHLRWRTFGCRAKAEREYRNIGRLRDLGIEAVEPIGYRVTRTNGCVRESTLDTVFVASRSLKFALQEGMGDARRRRLLSAAGELLREFHLAGFVSTSFYPRNLLIDDGDDALLVCDQPGLLHYGESIVGTRRADVDLFDLAFTSGRRLELSSTDRLRIVRAYTHGDPKLSRGIWRRIESKRRWTHRGVKGALKIAGLLGAFGAR